MRPVTNVHSADGAGLGVQGLAHRTQMPQSGQVVLLDDPIAVSHRIIAATPNGTLVVTEVDEDTVKGTFSALLKNRLDTSVTLGVTNGSFDIPVER